MINKVLTNQLWRACPAYLDDIIVFSKTDDDHLRDLQCIFSALSSAGLCLQPKKCHIAADSIKYMGYISDGRTVKPDPENIRAVAQVAASKDVKQVRSFLGLCNYYRRCVRDFSRIARPLTDLTKTDKCWEWNDECQTAFEQLKRHLTSSPVLQLFDPKLPVEVHTDSCGYGIGTVMVQKNGSQEHVIS